MNVIKVSFRAVCRVEGEQPTRDDLLEAFQSFVEDFEWGDQVIEYVPEDLDIDHFEVSIESVKVS